MKFRLFILIFMILLTSIVFAQNVPVKEDKTQDVSQTGSEIEIPKGQNATANLPMFSKTYIRFYEGTKLNFNIVDPDTNVILIKNSMILDKVRADNKIDVLFSTDTSNYEKVTLNTGEDYTINYTYSFNPNMVLTPLISHYDENNENSNVVMYFFVPSIKTSKTSFAGVKHPLIDISTITPTGAAVTDTKSKFNPFIASLILIAAMIAVYFFLIKDRN